jgi:UDP-glucose 4-epimerase
MIKKIFITGGLGLIGKELVKNLNNYKYNLIITDVKNQIKRHKTFIKSYKSSKIKFLECDITNKKKLLQITKNQDCIIHLAAMLGVKNTEKNIEKCWKINAQGTENVTEICKTNNIKRLIFSSSSEVYGESITKTISEKNDLLGQNIYACSKIAAENLILKSQFENKKLNFTILRLFNTYGTGQVAKFFIPNICKAIKENKNITINGDGSQMRSYAHASDIADAIKKCIQNKKSKNKIYNVGNPNEKLSLNQVLKIANNIKQIKKKIYYKKDFKKSDRNKNREIFFRVCNIDKIKNDLRFKIKISLKDGLKNIIESKIKIYSDWP